MTKRFVQPNQCRASSNETKVSDDFGITVEQFTASP